MHASLCAPARTRRPRPPRSPVRPQPACCCASSGHSAAPAPPPPSPPPAKAPLRVAVTGAGVGGLSLAHALTRLLGPGRVEVTVFEKTPKSQFDDLAGVGASLGLTGGAAVLHDLGLGPRLDAIGHPLERLLVRTVPRQAVLIDVPLARLAVDQARGGGGGGGGGAPRGGLVRDGRCVARTVLRSELVRELAASLDQAVVDLRLGARVAGLDAGRVVLAGGGREGPFDLVAAADGIRSAVRDAAPPAAAAGRPPEKPAYAGVRLTFAVSPRAAPPPAAPVNHPFGEVHQLTRSQQWCAPRGFALTLTAGGGESGGANVLVYCTRGDPPAAGQNVDWEASKAAAAAALSAGLRQNKFPQELSDIASNAATVPNGRVFELGIYDRAPAPASAWRSSSGGVPVVLLGDSIHAMTPFLGQGANQAVQDAYCLASKLRDAAYRGLLTGPHGIERALDAYASVRSGPTATLQRGSRFMSELDTLFSPLDGVRNAVLWTLGASGLWPRIFLSQALPKV